MRCRHKVSLSRELLIHHCRGPPSPTGEGFFICLKLKKLRRNPSVNSNLKITLNPQQIQRKFQLSLPNYPPLCHPERRATARSRTRRATVGRDLQTSSAPTPAPHFRNGKTPGQPYPFPLFKSLLKGARGKLFSRKVSPEYSPHRPKNRAA